MAGYCGLRQQSRDRRVRLDGGATNYGVMLSVPMAPDIYEGGVGLLVRLCHDEATISAILKSLDETLLEANDIEHAVAELVQELVEHAVH